MATLESALEGLMLEYLHDHIAKSHIASTSSMLATTTARRKRKLSLLQLEQRVVAVAFCYGKAVRNEPSCTERDMYYMHPQCFGSQQQLASVLLHVCDDLSGVATTQIEEPMGCGDAGGGEAAAVPVERSGRAGLPTPWTKPDLGIDATAKALLIGPLTFILQSSGGADRGSNNHPVGPTDQPHLNDITGTSSGLAASATSQQRVDVGKMGTRGMAIGSAIAASVVGLHFNDHRRQASASHHCTSPRRPHQQQHGHCDVTLRSMLCGQGDPSLPVLLVVEKESSVRHLINVDKVLETNPNCAILCTKGFPCAASRVFLRKFRSCLPDVPLLTMSDGDVFGLHIAWCLLKIPADDLTWSRAIQRRGGKGGAPVSQSDDGKRGEQQKKNRKSCSTAFAEAPRIPQASSPDLPLTGTTTPGPTPSASLLQQLRGCYEWHAFVSFAATVQHIGLTPQQIRTLRVPAAVISEVTAAEAKRAMTLCADIELVHDCAMECAAIDDFALNGGSRSTMDGEPHQHPQGPQQPSASTYRQAAHTLAALAQHLRAMASLRQKAELQSLVVLAGGDGSARGVMHQLLHSLATKNVDDCPLSHQKQRPPFR